MSFHTVNLQYSKEVSIAAQPRKRSQLSIGHIFRSNHMHICFVPYVFPHIAGSLSSWTIQQPVVQDLPPLSLDNKYYYRRAPIDVLIGEFAVLFLVKRLSLSGFFEALAHLTT